MKKVNTINNAFHVVHEHVQYMYSTCTVCVNKNIAFIKNGAVQWQKTIQLYVFYKHSINLSLNNGVND